MRYDINFGKLKSQAPQREAKTPGTFRIAVLGDFSGRANRGLLEAGAELARRKPIKLDVDTIDTVIEGFQSVLHLQIGTDGGSVEVRPTSLDDLHPDELYEGLGIFAELSGLRQRLDNSKTFPKAAAELHDWLEERAEKPVMRTSRRSRATAIRVDAKLSDFAQLIGKPAVLEDEATPADELIKQVVSPHIVEADDPDQDALIGAVDQALSTAMRNVLHHPDFQALEAGWRSLDFLVRRIESSSRLQLVLYDISADELAADLSATDALEDTGLYKLLVEQPALDAHQGALSVLIGNYTFEMTPPHAELLGRIAQIAAQARAPFIAAIGPDCITTKTDDLHPLVVDAWDALRSLPEACFLGLAVPRFLLRMPYGAKREPISVFELEEFDDRTGLRACLWGNPAILAAVLLGETFQQLGARLQLGKVLSLGDMPYFFYYDEDGEASALPCTERLLTERSAAHLATQNLMAVLAIKGRPEVRLAGFRSLAGTPLAGSWSPPGSIPTRTAATPTPPTSRPAEASEQAAKPAASSVAIASTTTEIEPEAPATEITADLDAPIGDLGIDDASRASDAKEASGTGDEELDALLADLGAADTQPTTEESMDPELAALLADL